MNDPMEQRERYEQIEAYLNNTLPPEQQQAWEQRLALDAALRQEVELHRQLQNDYDPGRLQLRANLRAIMDEPLPPAPGGRRRWAWWLGLLGGALLAAWVLWSRPEPAAIQPEAPPPDSRPAPPPAGQPQPPAADPSPPKAKGPIASADPARFKPHPGREALVNSGMRSENILVNITRPANGQRFRPDDKGRVQLRFTGTIEGPADQPAGTWVLLFFDNRTGDKPLLSVPLPVQAGAAGSLGFDLPQRLELSPGLYYFTVEAVEAGEVLYAGKFLVGG